MKKIIYHILISILFLLNKINTLHFYVDEKETKCFFEEIPEETLVFGKYKVQMLDKKTNEYNITSSSVGILIEIQDPLNEIFLSKVYQREGRFSFTSYLPGVHKICLNSNSTKWFGGSTLRIDLEIKIGENALDYNNIASKEKLTDFEIRVKKLLNQVDRIIKEQNYQRYCETLFRKISESTSRRVFWWSTVHLFVISTIGFIQFEYLMRFFLAKKLV